MKATCKTNGNFVGIIPDNETFEKYIDGEVDWKPHIKPKMEFVQIPVAMFNYFIELHKEELERQSITKKEKENENNQTTI